MLNKLLTESYNKVRSKADEVRQTVTLQAAKAREALGLPSLHRPDAFQLERQLEQQASQAVNLSQLHDIYVKWIAQIVTSSESDAPLYFDYQQSFPFDFPQFVLGTPEKAQDDELSPGDLCSKCSWITPYEKERASSASKEPQPPTREKKVSEAPLADGATFRQIFLRSQALEIALLSLARLETVRSSLVGPLDWIGMEASTRGALQRLMSLTLRGDAKIHTELLFLFCSVDLASETSEVHLRHLAELTALLKLDWKTDHYKDRMDRLTTEIEALKSSIREMAAEQIGPPEKMTDRIVSRESLATELDAIAGQLEKRCSISRSLVEASCKKNALLEKAAERNVEVDLKISERLAALVESSDVLADRFASLGNATSDLEKQLCVAIDQKTVVDEEVNLLQRQRRELLAQLESVETTLVAVLAQQRKAHDQVDTYRQKAAVAMEIKHQRELHQLDVKNMKMLIDQSNPGVEKRGEKEMSQQTGHHQTIDTHRIMLAYVKNEVERIQHDERRIDASLEVLRKLWTHQTEKEEELKQQRELYVSRQNEIGASHQPGVPPSPDVLEKRQELDEAKIALESTTKGLDAIRECVAQAQSRCLHAVNHLDSSWKYFSEFTESMNSRLKTLQREESDKDDFVDVEELDNSDSSSMPTNDLLSSEDIGSLVTAAQTIYTATKKKVAADLSSYNKCREY